VTSRDVHFLKSSIMSRFPQPFVSTVSHWQATVSREVLEPAIDTIQNRGPASLYGYGRDDELPSEVVDYVIIGAGMTGKPRALAWASVGD